MKDVYIWEKMTYLERKILKGKLGSFVILNISSEHFNLLDFEILATCTACENTLSFSCSVVV